MAKHWGFSTATIDTSVRPQDDFYQYANGGWIKKTKLPETEARWGSFYVLRYQTEQQLKKIVEDLVTHKPFPFGRPEQLVSDLYRSAADMPRRNKLGMQPLARERAIIQKIASVKDLVECVAHSHRSGVSYLWHSAVDQDIKNSTRYLLHLWQGGLGMPDRDYYLKNDAEYVRVREAYQEHIKKLLALAGKSEEEIETSRKVIMELETALARASMSKEETRDVDKTYHPMSLGGISKIAPNLSWRTYLTLLGAGVPGTVVVGQPKFFAALSRMFETVPLEKWKIYLEWHLINGSASALSQAFVQENFNFYATTLTGVKVMKPLWRRALSSVNGTVPDALGRLYVEKHFTPASKRAMDKLVTDIFAAYEERIKNIDWMSPATKKKAIQKLHQMNRKIGYPSKWEKYGGLVIKPDDFFGNLIRASEYEHRRQMRRLKKKVDRGEWFMSPQTVNAYCSFNLNDIVFPAAILQAPFFDANADAAVNYGGIGAVIGHEITHGFDDQGSKFDGKGNRKNWWTPQDRKRFEQKSKILVKQFDQYTVAPGVNANGKLTLGENIADLGGAAIAYDAYMRHLAKTGRKNIQGLTPEQRFFLGFAQAERQIAREEYIKTASLTDPHAHAPLRVNGPVSNLDPFYTVFELKEGDALYRSSKDRAKIW